MKSRGEFVVACDSGSLLRPFVRRVLLALRTASIHHSLIAVPNNSSDASSMKRKSFNVSNFEEGCLELRVPASADAAAQASICGSTPALLYIYAQHQKKTISGNRHDAPSAGANDAGDFVRLLNSVHDSHVLLRGYDMVMAALHSKDIDFLVRAHAHFRSTLEHLNATAVAPTHQRKESESTSSEWSFGHCAIYPVLQHLVMHGGLGLSTYPALEAFVLRAAQAKTVIDEAAFMDAWLQRSSMLPRREARGGDEPKGQQQSLLKPLVQAGNLIRSYNTASPLLPHAEEELTPQLIAATRRSSRLGTNSTVAACIPWNVKRSSGRMRKSDQ